jgi:hypothetical protein
VTAGKETSPCPQYAAFGAPNRHSLASIEIPRSLRFWWMSIIRLAFGIRISSSDYNASVILLPEVAIGLNFGPAMVAALLAKDITRIW